MQNQYDIIGEVGEGAYGIVMKCKNKETGEIVAIKKFKDIEDEIVQKSILREIKVLKSVKHHNIVQLKECFKRKKNLYLVLEYVEKNLLEVIEKTPNGLDQSLVKHYIYQLCKSVNYIHSLDLIHRDIKPENILITDDNTVKLCDFGFARTMPQKGGVLTDYVATRWYRSPELLLGSSNYGKEVDYWAIGCIMGEITDGQPMFPGENELNQLIMIHKLFGNFPQYQIDLFFSNPNFAGYKFESSGKPETLEKRYNGRLSKQGFAFLKGLLKLDPKERLSGLDVIMHPYFDDIRSEDPEFNKNPIPEYNFQNSCRITQTNMRKTQKLENKSSNKNMNYTKTSYFQENNKPNNYSKSPPRKEVPVNMSQKTKPIKKNTQQTTTSNNSININNNININVNTQGSTNMLNFKTFYNLNKKDDIYNYDIDVNYENASQNMGNQNINANKNVTQTQLNFKKGTKQTNHVNSNLIVIEEENLENENEKFKGQKTGNLQKTMYNKFKPDTGADYEEEVDNSPKNYQVNNNKKNLNNFANESRFTVTNWNNQNNPTYLPQINIRTNHDYEKKTTKMYYH